MDRFISNFTTRLDAKGRVSVPAPFRAVLARDGFEGLYVHPSLDWPTLDCGGHALLASVDAMLASTAAVGGDSETLALTLLGESDVLRMDGEGRVILPDALKQHAGIGADVSFVGVGHKFQIWEPSRFRARLAEARQQASVMRAAGGPGRAGQAATSSVPEARE